jgi:hypothetical protein
MSQQPAFRTNRTMSQGFPNKYAGTCERCRARVEVGEGITTKVDGQWVVNHRGDCLAQAEPAPAAPARSAFKVPDGRYTVTFADGTYKTLRVRTQDEDADFMPGRAILGYLSGANNDSDYTQFAHVDETGTIRVWSKHRENTALREAVKVLIDSPQASALAYAEQSGCCARCGRTLTVPSSLHAGFGPECATKVSF